MRTGNWDVGRSPPMALGVEAAGIITAVGESVEDWEPGRRGPRLSNWGGAGGAVVLRP